jgi:hypothetical protein
VVLAAKRQYRRLAKAPSSGAYLTHGLFSFQDSITFSLSPEHYRIDQGFGLLARDMSQCRDQLVEFRVRARAAYFLHRRFGFAQFRDGLVDLVVRLSDKLTHMLNINRVYSVLGLTHGVEKVVQRIFTDGL